MKAKITVLFYLRKSKVNAYKQVPIYQRMTINGRSFNVSTGQYVEGTKMKEISVEARTLQSWHNDTQKMDMQISVIKVGLYKKP